ncbi:MAG TPA: cupredoxin family copper-binding protein [Vicinamibacterales bacterium]|nr:cupredoxin family copper-binding protein [Vicinamibacterales bacterium]
MRVSSRSIVLSAATVLLVLAGPGRGVAARVPAPATYTVTMDSSRFEPAVLTVHAGDTVVWVNKDFITHTATAKGHFDSGKIAEGHSWSYVARTKGTFPYICTLHPDMKGTLRVQ